jgi:NADP-dependent 3-hydroxy acid dehydrogenase YdfG
MADDPVLLITGASSGIGEATARAAVDAGYRLVLAARSEEKLAELAKELGGEDRAIAVRCDVTEWSDQETMVAKALEQFGRLDVALANAGFGAPRGFLNSDPDHWKAMVLTNVYGVALTVRAALPALKETEGHLILTSSVAGRRALPGSLYAATKAAVHSIGEAARLELDRTGVRVTVIAPGITDTPFFDNPQGDGLRPADVADAVLYAVSRPAHIDVNEVLVRPTAQQS